MNKLRELQLKEAIKRLKILQQQYNLMETVITEFEKEGTLYYSERVNQTYRGMLFWIDNKKEFLEIIEQFEKKQKSVVYHAILSHKEFGDILNLLYISPYQKEWENDNEELKRGFPLVYCSNVHAEKYSEFGTIQIVGVNGGIDRIN